MTPFMIHDTFMIIVIIALQGFQEKLYLLPNNSTHLDEVFRCAVLTFVIVTKPRSSELCCEGSDLLTCGDIK